MGWSQGCVVVRNDQLVKGTNGIPKRRLKVLYFQGLAGEFLRLICLDLREMFTPEFSIVVEEGL